MPIVAVRMQEPDLAVLPQALSLPPGAFFREGRLALAEFRA